MTPIESTHNGLRQLGACGTMYIVRRTSSWSGYGAVDYVVAAAATRKAAQRLAAEHPDTEGQYGPVNTRVQRLPRPKSIGTLLGKGGELDPRHGGRVWIGGRCVVSTLIDVDHYRAMGYPCREITAAEARYIEACDVLGHASSASGQETCVQ